ncbi:Pleckstrin y domain-containing H member 2, partial [Branchiostoma belcheri]
AALSQAGISSGKASVPLARPDIIVMEVEKIEQGVKHLTGSPVMSEGLAILRSGPVAVTGENIKPHLGLDVMGSQFCQIFEELPIRLDGGNDCQGQTDRQSRGNHEYVTTHSYCRQITAQLAYPSHPLSSPSYPQWESLSYIHQTMQELERRVQEADAKADKAEEQLRVMEQKQVTQNIDVRQSTSALFVRIQELETACREKDDVIVKLEIQLEEQTRQQIRTCLLSHTCFNPPVVAFLDGPGEREHDQSFRKPQMWSLTRTPFLLKRHGSGILQVRRSGVACQFVNYGEGTVCSDDGELPTTKELRAQEGEMVEKKAAKIKEWVYNKLGELEEENERLRRTHQQSMYALESLQKKLQESQTKSAVVPASGCSSPGPAGVSGGVPQVARPSSPSVPPAPHTSMVRDHEPDGEATINFSEQDRVLETDLDKPENFILNAVDDFEEEKMDLESECALTPVSSRHEDSLIEEQMYKKFELQRLDSSSSSSESQS